MPDLPVITRWTANAKRELVEKVARGNVELAEALRFYRLSADEFASWQRDYPARETAR